MLTLSERVRESEVGGDATSTLLMRGVGCEKLDMPATERLEERGMPARGRRCWCG